MKFLKYLLVALLIAFGAIGTVDLLKDRPALAGQAEKQKLRTLKLGFISGDQLKQGTYQKHDIHLTPFGAIISEKAIKKSQKSEKIK